MRRTFSLVLFVAVCLAGAAPLVVAADDFKLEPGFTLIFNGKNLDGWVEAKGDKAVLDGKAEAHKGRFKVSDGTLVYDPTVKGDAYIETAKKFDGNVHIKFDFKPGPKCNNDIFFMGTKFDIVPGNKENAKVKEGAWSTMEIVVKGDKLEHIINSEVARTTKIGIGPTSLKLRAEFGEIVLKNIRVKEEKPD